MIFSEKNDENSYYEVYSIATPSFAPPNTLTIPLLYSIKQKLVKFSSRRVRSTSPKLTDASSYYAPHSIATIANTYGASPLHYAMLFFVPSLLVVSGFSPPSSSVPPTHVPLRQLDHADSICDKCSSSSNPCFLLPGGYWSFTTEADCEINNGGELCVKEACTVDNCTAEACYGAVCTQCVSGFIEPTCESEASYFSDVTISIQDGIVALASPNLHGLLKSGFEGTTSRRDANILTARAFEYFFNDTFSLIYVYPSTVLSNNIAS